MDSSLELHDQLYAWLKGCQRLVVIGIGNPLRGDDAIGLKVIQKLSRKIPENVRLLECGVIPENYFSKIEEFKPTHVLMIDAAHLNGEAGASRLISIEEIAGTALSTHTLPLSFLAEIIKQNIGADVKLLGIQPESVEFKEGLSPKLQEASRKIADLVMKVIKESFQDTASNEIRAKRFSC